MFAKNVLILGLAAVASAQAPPTTPGFTDGGITCTDGTSITKDQIMAAMVGPSGPLGNLREAHAATLASGNCVTNQNPLYAVQVAGKVSLNYAYDQSANSYTFCFANIGGAFGSTCQPAQPPKAK
ncbi:hypothetical protein PspLS_09740 [Pyricularia sp. CBS 133598]|nr:hypothetical protein PspLS_09740 [Pyricularia sp. CBS 133598]